MASKVAKAKADLKVIILGAAGVGKTTFIHRFIEGTFQKTITSVGASFYLKQWMSYNIAIWDTAGEERFTGLSSFYCRSAGAAILAYDLTSVDSFHSLRARFIPLLQAADPNCLVVLVGMKQDLLTTENRAIDQKDAMILAKEVNIQKLDRIPYYEASSVTGHNVKNVFEYIFETCLPSSPRDPDVVTISDMTPEDKKKLASSCSC